MINFDDATEESKKTKKSKLVKNSEPSLDFTNNRRLWIRKKNPLPNLISDQPDIDKIYLYV